MTTRPPVICLVFIMLIAILVAGCITSGPKPVTNGTSYSQALSNSNPPVTVNISGNMGATRTPTTTIAGGTAAACQTFTQTSGPVRSTITAAADDPPESTPTQTPTTNVTSTETIVTDTPEPTASPTLTNDSTTPSFSASQSSGPAPLTIRFTESSTSDLSNHLWNFGDNQYDSGSRDPVHTYTKPGRYTVVMIASGADGSGEPVTRADYITVTPPDVAPPTSGTSVASSTSRLKSTAQYICDGSNDQTEIQAAINAIAAKGGGDVYLLDGTFNVAGDIRLLSGVNLIGRGAGITTLSFVSEGEVQVDGNNTIRALEATGPTGIIIVGSRVRCTDVNIKNYSAKKGAFYIYAYNKDLSDVIFTNCNAIDGSSHGFINSGEGSPNSISGITYTGCSAINAGRASQFNPWVNGFTLAESTTINKVLVEKSWADGCWESGFYLTEGRKENNVTIRNCISACNGQKKAIEEPFYGAGFFGGSQTVRFSECISQNNKNGFSLRSGATAVQCNDIGSINGFSTTDNAGITLTDCWSDHAQVWAFYALNSHDVTATHFKVTNPKGNSYPAVYTGGRNEPVATRTSPVILAGSPHYPSYNMNIQTTAT